MADPKRLTFIVACFQTAPIKKSLTNIKIPKRLPRKNKIKTINMSIHKIFKIGIH